MKPILFTVQGIHVESLAVFFVLGFLAFVILAWFNLRTYVKPYKIFDTAVFSIIIAVCIGRVVFFIQHLSAFSSNGWYFLPFRDTPAGVDYFNTLPWNFLAIWDKGVYYNFIPFALGLSAIMFLGTKKNLEFIQKVLPLVWLSFIPAYVFVLVGFLLDGTYVGKASGFPIKVTYAGLNETRIAVQLLEVLALVISLVFYLDSKSTRKSKFSLVNIRFLLFPLFWTVVEVVLWFWTDGHMNKLLIFDVVQITWVLLLLIYLFTLLPYFPKKNKGGDNSQINERRKFKRVFLSDLKKQNISITGQQQVQQNNPSYSVSFSNLGKNAANPQLSGKEKFNQIKNKLRRKKL